MSIMRKEEIPESPPNPYTNPYGREEFLTDLRSIVTSLPSKTLRIFRLLTAATLIPVAVATTLFIAGVRPDVSFGIALTTMTLIVFKGESLASLIRRR